MSRRSIPSNCDFTAELQAYGTSACWSPHSQGLCKKRPTAKADIFDLAAAYLFRIAKNHPFVDGNKRTALAAADTFLFENGFSLEADPDDLTQFVLLVAAGNIDERGAAVFFKDHCEPA